MATTPTTSARPDPEAAAPTPPPAPLLPDGFPLDSDITERAIPIRPCDLTRLLLAEPDLSSGQRIQLSQLGKMFGAVFHYEYHAWLDELKELYAPFDPDSDCIDLEGLSRVATDHADEAFLAPMEAALIRANYRPLRREVIEHAVKAPNEQGLNFVPDFSLFEHLKVYVRGNTRVVRAVRNLRTKFRKRQVVFDGYERFVVALKFKPGVDLGEYVRSDVIYLRLFKDVPHVDMEMHLPEQGTKVKMRWIDRLQIASPLFTGVPTLAMKLFKYSLMTNAAFAGVVFAPFSLAINSFFGFQRARQRHMHRMIRHLYYLTLATNASVITSLVDAAEEEEYKEALLAYYVLWRGADDPSPWDEGRLDAHVESFLKEKTGMTVDFEVKDALRKLVRLGLVQPDRDGHLRAAPVEEALAILDRQWDGYFRYAAPAAAVPPLEP
jgi:hypothetical protein